MEVKKGRNCVDDTISISAQSANTVGVMSTTEIIGDSALDHA